MSDTTMTRQSFTNQIPIIFAIDNNVVMQCGVTITSLLKNVNEDTFYDIFILCNASLPDVSRERLSVAFAGECNCSISFVDVGSVYNETKLNGHVTTATYYRLLIPSLFPQFDKAFYSDVDVIFQQDLADLYANEFADGELLAAVRDLAIDDKFFFNSSLPENVGCNTKAYFNAGFLLMNLKAMRDESVATALDEHAKLTYPQNDQDVLNIVSKGRVRMLPSLYNFQLTHFVNYCWGRKQIEIGFRQLFQKGTLHYTGPDKPWNSLQSVAADAWWHYYRLSPFYDDAFYFQRQCEQVETCRRDMKKQPVGKLFKQALVRLKKQIVRRPNK